mmetsp:Transcript_49448/g.59880  ORF Transcript_49448/g.59880 Transcript_49448/m.59880 type:complete len:84 (+) Transcript_49448:259-510(+)
MRHLQKRQSQRDVRATDGYCGGAHEIRYRHPECEVHVFFRDAAAKFVSCVVYVKMKKQGARVRDIVEEIRRRMTNAVAWGSII